MTRRFLDDIRADVNTLVTRCDTDFPDNNVGSITPAVLRNFLVDSNNLRIDEIDSQKQDEATLAITVDQINFPITNTWTPIANYDLSAGDDSTGEAFLNVAQAAGTVTTKNVAGWTYEVTGYLSFEGGANDRFDLAILENGAPIGFIGSATGEGGNDPVSILATVTIPSTTASTVFSMAIQTDDPQDIDIFSAILQVSVLPTNNP